jgi:hypothetical protein
VNATIKSYLAKTVRLWSARMVSSAGPLLALVLIWASIAQAAATSHLTRPTALKANEAAYVTDVTGKRVRIVGPRFYPNPTKGLTFPGRSATLPDRPKRQ